MLNILVDMAWLLLSPILLLLLCIYSLHPPYLFRRLGVFYRWLLLHLVLGILKTLHLVLQMVIQEPVPFFRIDYGWLLLLVTLLMYGVVHKADMRILHLVR